MREETESIEIKILILQFAEEGQKEDITDNFSVGGKLWAKIFPTS